MSHQTHSTTTTAAAASSHYTLPERTSSIPRTTTATAGDLIHPNSAAKARVSSSNPLENLLKDLKCCICLSITKNPVSLPCNHFFCDTCLQRLMDEEAKKTAETRKLKSNATLKLSSLCPECRFEYNRRNIVEDPVVRKIAKLCAALQLQPDVRELLSKDDSIFDMSQASPLTSPHRRPTRATSDLSLTPPNRSPPQSAAAAAAANSTTTRRRLIPTPTPASSSRTMFTNSTPATSNRRSLVPPAIPADFADDDRNKPGTKSKHKSPTPTAAASSSTPMTDITNDPLPIRSSGRPSRRAALLRKSYKEAETQMEFTPDDDQLMGGDTSSNDESDSNDPLQQLIKAGHASDADNSNSDTPLSSYVVPSSTSRSSASPTSAAKPKKTYSPVALDPNACAVCGQVSDEEAVVTCKGCKVKVHSQLCYGPCDLTLTDKDRTNWWCDRCSEKAGTKDVTCSVCPNVDDQAFKKTDKGGWIHASCATWLSGPRWRDALKRNMVCDIKKIPRGNFSIPCKFCTGKGAILQCSYGHNNPAIKCAFGYHIPCGVRYGIQFEMRSPDESSQEMEESDDVFFHSFCFKHIPLADTVPSCNSLVSASAKKQRNKRRREQATKRGRRKKNQLADEDDEMATAGDTDENDDSDGHDAKRVKHETKKVNRSINLAETSMDTTVDSTTETPLKLAAMGDAALFTALFNAPSTSPFTTPTATTPPAAAAANTPSPNSSAIRKLEFSPPAKDTMSVSITTRTSPNRATLPFGAPMLRSASAGAMSSQSTQSTLTTSLKPFKPSLSRPSSLRQQSDINQPATTAAAAATLATRATAANTTASSSTPTTRVALRSMGRDEVNQRDSQVRNSNAAAAAAASSTAVPKPSRTLARRQLVLLGTKLDKDQQALLEELATTLNEAAAKDKNEKQYAEKFVIVQNQFDESVTHVITTATEQEEYILQTRTLKYFQGLLSGAWVLGVDWVSASLCAQKTMPENDYLVRGDIKLNGGEITNGARRARNARDQSMKLFSGLNFIWLTGKPSMKEDACKLIELGGGEVRTYMPYRTTAKDAHDSDMDDGDSQMEDLNSQTASQTPGVTSTPTAASNPRARHHVVSPIGKERFLLLVDDTSAKRKPGQNRSKVLESLVAPIDWQHCIKHHIDIVGVTWLFDSISAFKLQSTEKPWLTNTK